MSKKQFLPSNYFLPRVKLEDLLHRMGVTIAGDTGTDLICYCPFHSNRDSPAFNISLTGPHLWKCHNGKCNAKGNVISLITLKGYTRKEAERMVFKGTAEISDLVAHVDAILFPKSEKVSDKWQGVDVQTFIDADAQAGFPALNYLKGRGVNEEAYKAFKLGYSRSKGMLVIPVVDDRDRLCGVIGREIESKRYQYSTGLARRDLIWNIQNAKQYDSIILTEGALDAVYLWQAGYKNVGAVLGSAISPNQWNQLRKYFSSVTCFFDNDEAGEHLTESICESVTDLSVFTVKYPERMVEYVDANGEKKERPVKDAGELTAEEIQSMLENKKSSLLKLFNPV